MYILCVYVHIEHIYISSVCTDVMHGHRSSEWMRESICIDDPHETTPSESLVIQYAVELKVTYIRLACTATSIDWVASSWITKTSMLCLDSPRNPFNCLPCSNISQCMQRLITKENIRGWQNTVYIPFGGTGHRKWICESSYFFKKQEGHACLKI